MKEIQPLYLMNYVIRVLVIFRILRITRCYGDSSQSPLDGCSVSISRHQVLSRHQGTNSSHSKHEKLVQCWSNVVDGGPTINQHWECSALNPDKFRLSDNLKHRRHAGPAPVTLAQQYQHHRRSSFSLFV